MTSSGEALAPSWTVANWSVASFTSTSVPDLLDAVRRDVVQSAVDSLEKRLTLRSSTPTGLRGLLLKLIEDDGEGLDGAFDETVAKGIDAPGYEV